MKIQIQDRFHGPALMQIVEHESFKALNKADDLYGHYLVNKDVRLWFKYASAKKGPWTFTFQSSDLASISKELGSSGSTFIVLVCGQHTICCVDSAHLGGLIDLDADAAQWIKVDAPSGKQMRVTGSVNHRTPMLVPHNAFPSAVFGG